MNDRLEFKAALTVDDAGTITGIAWPFGSPDRVGDVIEKGAFVSPARLPMLFAHDQGQAVGVWDEVAETTEGLTVKGRLLVQEVERAREVRALVREGAVSGLSIGFVTKQAKARSGGGRTISRLELHEISIVAVPSHPAARITSMKSAATDGAALSPAKGNAMENEEIEQKAADPVVTAEELKALKSRLDKIEAKSNRPAAANSNVPAADNDNIETKAFDTFLRRGEHGMTPEEVKALTVANDAQAGYLAPETIGAELIKLLREYSPIRQYARVVSVGGTSIKYPRRVGSTAGFWTEEGAARTASQPSYEQITITPHELATYTDVTQKLLEDNSYNLDGELVADFAESFGITEGAAFILGDGVGKPVGLLNADGLKEVTTGAAAGFPASNPADVLIGMYHELPAAHASRGVWLMNNKTLGTLRKFKDGNGRYLLVEPVAEGMPTTILGRPVAVMPDMPDIAADAFPVIFGDLQGYRITDRVQFATLRDPYTQAANGIVRFHARKRVGADVTHPDRFVKLQIAA